MNDLPTTPKRIKVKHPKESLVTILTQQLDLLAVIASQRLLDRQEQSLLETLLKMGLCLSDSDLEAPKTTKKLTQSQLLEIVESDKK
jgi:hypothetical protein